MSAPTDTRPAAAPSANGDLVNRVQQLRLGEQIGTARRAGGSWLPWVLCGILALTWAGVGVRWYKAPSASGDAPAGTARPAGSTSGSGGTPAANPAMAPGEIVFTLKGTLTPSLQITASPIDVSGEVIFIDFFEGKRVKKGDILARLRDTRYQNEYKSAVANHVAAKGRLEELLPASVRQVEKDQAKAELDEAEANKVRARQEMTRLEDQRAKGIAPAADYDKAVADLKAAEARVIRAKTTLDILVEGPRKERVAAAQADLEAAEARMLEARRLLENCVIRAPIDGTVLNKKADIGSLVSPAAFNVPTGLCEIADLSKLEVEIDVPERQIVKVRPRLDCQIMADADRGRVYRGYVDRVMPIADDSKNVIKIRVIVILPPGEEPGSFLKPKMSVDVVGYNRDYAEKK